MLEYYVLHVLILISIYTILVVSLDLVAGHTGLLSLAHAAFYGIGAYSTALASIHLGFSLAFAMGLSMALAAGASLGVSIPSRRLHEDYWVIATFGFQMVVVSVANNWTALTNGPLGIRDIPQPALLGWSLASRPSFALLAGVLMLFAYGIVVLFTSSPFGRVLHAIREDEAFVWSLGKDTLRPKVVVMAVSAMLAACAGGLYAYYSTYVDPTSFTVMESILVLSMVIIGGAGTKWGPLIGAAFLVAVLEILELLGIPSTLAANIRQMVYGTLLVVLLIMRPQGLTVAAASRSRLRSS